MGADCRLLMPPETRVEHVTLALGMLAGLPGKTEQLSGTGGGEYLVVPGAKISSERCAPGYVCILLKGNMVDEHKNHHVLYFYEVEYPGGWRGIYPPSTAFWVACCIRMIVMFGGKFTANDCEDNPYTLERPRPHFWPERNPDDPGVTVEKLNADFQLIQNFLAAIKPISNEEMARAAKYAAYGHVRP